MSKIFRRIFPVVLFLGTNFLCWLFVLQYGVFGSEIDWISQHSVLPDYFRQHFYQTGELFPDIAWNLGGGQNIYHFAYYGLYNPVYMLSYLLPFVPTDSYLMGSSIICYGISGVLFYFWLPKERLSFAVRALTACMFVLAAPLLYHSYNQLMFVNYMPFLLLTLTGLKKSIGRKEKYSFVMLTAGLAGMIFSSFYFSIGGMAAAGLYGISLHLERRPGGFIREAMKLCVPAVIAVMLAGILLVPTAAALFQGGRNSGTAQNTGNALVQFLPQRFWYSPYGIGLSVLAFAGLLAGVFCAGRRGRRFLSIGLLAIFLLPVFGYLLNGGLYNKDKVFIPFLPLVCLLTAEYAEDIPKNRKAYLRGMLPYGITILLVLYSENAEGISIYKPYIMIDLAAMFILYLLGQRICGKKKHIPWQLAVSCILLFCSGWAVNKEGRHMIPRQEYENITSREKKNAVQEVLSSDTSWYRMEQYGNGAENLADINRIWDIRQNISSLYSSIYNPYYEDFRKNTFAINEPFRNNMMQSVTDNPCFLQFIGVKYLQTDQAPAGYRLWKESNGISIYQAKNTAPVVYATNQFISEEEYKSLSFPDNQTTLLQRAVIPGDTPEEREQDGSVQPLSFLPPCNLTLPELYEKNITIKKIPQGYEIEAKKETEVTAEVSPVNTAISQSNNVFALQFDVENENPDKDLHIRLQGQTNRLSAADHEYANHNETFSYMVTYQQDTQTIPIKFGKGKYRIKDIKANLGSLDHIKNKNLYQSPLQPLSNPQSIQKSANNRNPSGTIKTDKDGYLITSIPYDKNFTIWVDGKKSELLKVNTTFIGTRLPAGNHHIEITYEAPGKEAGLLISLCGVFLLIMRLISTFVPGGLVLQRT